MGYRINGHNYLVCSVMPHVSIVMKNRFRFMLMLVAISCAFPVLALVEDVTEDGVVQKEDRTIYRPLFFDRYAPQTAADMVIQEVKLSDET